jgi:hypothetical protein
MPARIDICNQAVALLPAAQMADLDEVSLEARECRRFYPQVIAEMLEGPHDWSFQNRRVALATVTNDRTAEWAYAYALPADMAAPIRLVPNFDALGLDIPIPLPGEPYAEIWASFATLYEAPYRIENGILYTNIENASLEYGIKDITEAVLPSMVVKAIVADLASRLAMPVKKDKELRQSLSQEAELYWQRAMAEDQNRQPQYSVEPGYMPEALLARGC